MNARSAAELAIDQALAWQQSGDRVILVTVVGVQGSSPREVGAQLFVTPDGLVGSVGGGTLEHIAVARARTWLRKNPQPPRFTSFPLGADSRQCCGGVVVLLFEEPCAHGLGLLRDARIGLAPAVTTVLATGRKQPAPATGAACSLDGAVVTQSWHSSRPPIALFGAGHVGTAIVRALEPLDFPLYWFDERAELLSSDARTVTRCGSPLQPEDLAAIPAGACWLIMTHRHDRDLELVRQAMERGDFGFLGLIGSKTKRRRFQRELARDGVAQDQIDQLVCPIGIKGITGKEPAVIAASVAAQLLCMHSPAARKGAHRSGISEKAALASDSYMALC